MFNIYASGFTPEDRPFVGSSVATVLNECKTTSQSLVFYWTDKLDEVLQRHDIVLTESLPERSLIIEANNEEGQALECADSVASFLSEDLVDVTVIFITKNGEYYHAHNGEILSWRI